MEVRSCAFRVYSGPKGVEDVSALDKEQMLFKEFAALDDALLVGAHRGEARPHRRC